MKNVKSLIQTRDEIKKCNLNKVGGPRRKNCNLSE